MSQLRSFSRRPQGGGLLAQGPFFNFWDKSANLRPVRCVILVRNHILCQVQARRLQTNRYPGFHTTKPGSAVHQVFHQAEVLPMEQKEVKIIISDTGSGIPPKELPHIFERYRKGKILSDSEKGSGLGLAIVKKIMDLHRTTINVESNQNKGTKFQFSLGTQNSFG